MDVQSIFNIVVGVAVPLALALGGAVWGRITQLEKDLSNHRVEVARDYAPADKLDGLEAKILQRLDQIWEELKNKADK